MSKLKQLIKNPRVIILIVTLLICLYAIRPNPWNEGVVIKAVVRNSTAHLAGIENPKQTLPPMAKEKIIALNNEPITNLKDYYEKLGKAEPNSTISLKTNKNFYKLGLADSLDLGLRVDEVPTSNIRKGLDLQGGTRVLLEPESNISEETFTLLLDNMRERLNVYGLADVIVTEVRDRPAILGGGKRLILVEIAGATEEEVKFLLAKQGKFEGKIANNTVFSGPDIKYVCRSAQCSGINPNRPCGKTQQGWGCGFYFAIALSQEAARRQADITQNLTVVNVEGEKYLSQKLELFLDDAKVDELNIGADLKGRPVTDISIQGGGTGISETDAVNAAIENMRRLQTILVTGSLPAKIELKRTDTISPALGVEFLKNAVLIAVLALIAVSAVLVIAYRKFSISIPIIITSLSEITIVLGLASIIGWNIDLAAIAGIVAAVGTGVDDQIVITDEFLHKGIVEVTRNWKEKIKRAFFIIMASYFATVVAMLPLWFAGAGMLKGFAITTILGVSAGVFITRPAYSAFMRIMFGE